jgi:large subunit ribosomal protein L16
MLSPKRTKYRKYHRGRMRGTKTRGNEICFGNFGLQAKNRVGLHRVKLKPLVEQLHVIQSVVQNYGFEFFPDKTVTARAAESRMGSGKGAVDYWVAVVKPGTILFEIGRVPEEVARAALKLASYKLPIKTKFIVKDTIN